MEPSHGSATVADKAREVREKARQGLPVTRSSQRAIREPVLFGYAACADLRIDL
jgi:hypothetical protein